MTEQNDLTQQDPDRRPREELDQEQSMGEPGERGFSLTGMTDDASAVIPPDAADGRATDDGVPIGSADVEADAERTDADR